MLKIIKFELSKQLKRRENLMVLFMFLLPLLYSIGISSNSAAITYNSSDPVTGLSFARSMYIFVYMVFIIHLILAINSSNILRGEMDNGSISMMISRINDRNKIYKAKFFSQIIYWLAITVLFVVFSIICFYLFISQLEISNGELIDQKFIGDIFIIIAVCSTFALAISMVQSISMYFKTYVSIGIFIVSWIILVYFKEFPVVRLISPIYYLENLIDSGDFFDFLKSMILNAIMVSLLNKIGKRKFQRSDM